MLQNETPRQGRLSTCVRLHDLERSEGIMTLQLECQGTKVVVPHMVHHSTFAAMLSQQMPATTNMPWKIRGMLRTLKVIFTDG